MMGTPLIPRETAGARGMMGTPLIDPFTIDSGCSTERRDPHCSVSPCLFVAVNDTSDITQCFL